MKVIVIVWVYKWNTINNCYILDKVKLLVTWNTQTHYNISVKDQNETNKKNKNHNLQNYNFTCGSVWAWNLVSHFKAGTQTEGVWEQGVEHNTWTEERWSDNSDNLYSKPEYHVVSKTFLISKNTAAANMLLQFRVMWSTSLVHWSVILWSAWKLN
jgi:hypothetical protein